MRIFYHDSALFMAWKKNRNDVENGCHEFPLVGDRIIHCIMNGQAAAAFYEPRIVCIY